MKSPLAKFAIFVISLVVSAWALHQWLLKDWYLIGMLLMSVFLHEMGHYSLFLIYGEHPSMFFIPFVGAAVRVENWWNKLNYTQIAMVSLAGPSVNFGLFIVGYLWYLSGDHHGMQLMSLNASLVWTNLIPLLILDGRKFAKSLFASLDEEGDKVAAGIISVLAMIAGFTLIFAGKAWFSYLLIYYGINKESHEDDRYEYRSPRAMSIATAKILAAVYAVMMVSTMIVSAFLPVWLK